MSQPARSRCSGHPTGRLLLARDGYAVDLDAVIDAAAEAGTMIEINANPTGSTSTRRTAAARESRGVTIVINPDAHSTGGLGDLDYGVGVARRAGSVRADVFNTAPLEAVASALSASSDPHLIENQEDRRTRTLAGVRARPIISDEGSVWQWLER